MKRAVQKVDEKERWRGGGGFAKFTYSFHSFI
jgi:hypothetical protein